MLPFANKTISSSTCHHLFKSGTNTFTSKYSIKRSRFDDKKGKHYE